MIKIPDFTTLSQFVLLVASANGPKTESLHYRDQISKPQDGKLRFTSRSY
jgi:hypothetical protein